jgi:HPt (histidine-containing phosphotransfer) domain-containing protein
MDDAKAAAEAEEWDHLAYIVHQLGGAASIIGATSLTNRCHDLKICIEEQLSPQRILSALADVEVEVDRVRDVLAEQVPDATSTGGTKRPAG